jgi:folate-binding protein YgfZ
MTESTLPASEWLAFLQQQNAVSAGGGAPADFVAPLTNLGLLAFKGEEAASFLHNQLTNDVEHLGVGEVRLAGYCSPKGRLLATMLIWKHDDAIILLLPRALLPAIQKRLQMFVLRAKVKVQDISDQQAILGLAGDRAAAALQTWFPELPAQPYVKIDNTSGSLMRLADGADGIARYQWIAVNGTAIAAWPQLRITLEAAGEAAWKLGDIQAGVPQITAATQEKFVPQMINFELIGGVNFKKGCYPGQEIVARSQYLGKLKRRMMLATIEGVSDDAAAAIQPGVEIFSSADPEQPCGTIVNAEIDGSDGGNDNIRISCLTEIKLTAPEAGSVHVGSASGPMLHFHPLPYSLADSIADSE